MQMYGNMKCLIITCGAYPEKQPGYKLITQTARLQRSGKHTMKASFGSATGPVHVIGSTQNSDQHAAQPVTICDDFPTGIYSRRYWHQHYL